MKPELLNELVKLLDLLSERELLRKWSYFNYKMGENCGYTMKSRNLIENKMPEIIELINKIKELYAE